MSDCADTWDAAALADLAAYCESQRTTGLLVVSDRGTVLEMNWLLAPGSDDFARRLVHGRSADGALREDVASQQKSVVSLLAAIAVDRGVLDVARPVSDYAAAGWSRATGAEERAIAVHHLLEMNCGLRDDLHFEAPPGQRHHYNTPAYAVMLSVLEGATGQSIDAITQDWLTDPASMTDTEWCVRGGDIAADYGNRRGLVSTPRDLARLGQIVLEGGVAAGGARIVSDAQLRLMLRRTALNPAYARLWWVNGGDRWFMPGRGEGPGSVVATAPPDAVFAMGSENRLLMIVPSQRLIVVRLGRQALDADVREQIAARLERARRPARALLGHGVAA